MPSLLKITIRFAMHRNIFIVVNSIEYMKIFLIRHGECNKHSAELDLTKRGKLQSKAATKELAKVHIDKVYVSAITRAKQTAEPYLRLKSVRVVEDPNVNEIYRILTGRPPKPNQPKGRAKRDRINVENFWKTLQNEKGNIAVFAHANVIRYILTKALGVGPKTLRHVLIHNGSISMIELENKQVKSLFITSTPYLN